MDRRQQSPQQIFFLSILLPSLFLVIGTTLTISYLSQYGQTFAPIELIYYISRLSPFAFGTWAGLMWPGSHPRAYILIGVSIGLIDLTALVLAAAAIYGTVAFGPAGWIEHISYHALPPIVLFASGGIFGDFVEDRLGEGATNYVLGIVSAAVTAVGSIITILLENS
jgi:hypothetical protein